jgi:hypothetical protein
MRSERRSSWRTGGDSEHQGFALHSTPGVRSVCMSGVIGPARVSAVVGRSNRMERYMRFLSLVIFVLCGCSDATQPPARFSRRLSSADRLEVTNRHYAFGKTITGADISSLTTAIKSAKKKTWGARMDWNSPRSWEVEFFAGTNRLAVIPVCYGVFKLESAEYSDGSGLVKAFWKKLEALEEQRTR